MFSSLLLLDILLFISFVIVCVRGHKYMVTIVTLLRTNHMQVLFYADYNTIICLFIVTLISRKNGIGFRIWNSDQNRFVGLALILSEKAWVHYPASMFYIVGRTCFVTNTNLEGQLWGYDSTDIFFFSSLTQDTHSTATSSTTMKMDHRRHGRYFIATMYIVLIKFYSQQFKNLNFSI